MNSTQSRPDGPEPGTHGGGSAPLPQGVAGDVLVPFTLELSPIRRLLVIDVADDPIYRALEPQVLDQPDGSTGLVLLAYRHDDHVELYSEPTLEIDPSGYEGLGQGLAGIHPTPFEAARFEVAADGGLRLDVTFAAPNGRSFDLHIREHLSRRRDAFAALAPVGGAFTAPGFFPFVWLPSLSFLPARGTEVAVRVDGQERTIARLPLPLGGRRCLMARYDPDAMVCQVNPAGRTEIALEAARGTAAADGPNDVDVVDVDGEPCLSGVRVRRGERTCSLSLQPPLPDLRRMASDARVQGTVTLSADDAVQLHGRYGVEGADGHVDLRIDQIGPWRTRQRRPLLALLFRLPIFRRWPTTYQWEAQLDLTTVAPTLTSCWTRKGAAPDEPPTPVPPPDADAAAA